MKLFCLSSDDNVAIKYTIHVILTIKFDLFFFLTELCVKKIKSGQSKAQQQYVQGFFKKKACQRQVDAVQCRSEPTHQAGESRPAN